MGGLSLYSNQLASLPESFGKLRIGSGESDGLWLQNNKLCSLPASFVEIEVAGDLDLSANPGLVHDTETRVMDLNHSAIQEGDLKVGGRVRLEANEYF